jgi:hypothetical protein
VDLFFNELSLTSLAPDRIAGRDRLLSLQSTVHAAVQRGLPNVLRTHQGFWEAPIAEGYTVSDWLRDPTIDRERRRFMSSAVGKAPFLEALHDDTEAARGDLVEALFAGRRGLGIGLAVLHDAPAVSLPAPAFSVDPLEIVLATIGEAGLEEMAAFICNLHSPAAVERRAPWIAKRQREEVLSGNELLRLSAQLLEHVEFTDNAIEQLRALRGTEKTFHFVVRHLFALNERARAWDVSKPFEVGYPFRCSEESESTLAAWGETRTFRCPDGVRRVFSWHSKIACEAWRIHFRTSPEARRVLIGYVGKHLPLA